MSPALTGPYAIPQSTSGTLSGTVLDAQGKPVLLNLAEDVRLGIEPVSPALGVPPRLIDLRVDLARKGWFAWDYEPSDVGVAGLFRGQVRMVMPDGPKSFPSDGYLDIAVLPMAGAARPARTWEGHGPPNLSLLPDALPGDTYVDLDTGDTYTLEWLP